jgi:hypothetical protein
MEIAGMVVGAKGVVQKQINFRRNSQSGGRASREAAEVSVAHGVSRGFSGQQQMQPQSGETCVAALRRA